MLIFFLCCYVTVSVMASGVEEVSVDTPSNPVGIEHTLDTVPICFIENQGQVDSEDVFFYVKGAYKTLYFTSRGLSIAILQRDGGQNQRWTMTLEFEGADRVEPRGGERRKAVFSYFKGEETEWKTAIPTFDRIGYDDLWPGIDLVYSGTVQKLKYEFVVAPGADPAAIRLAYRGATEVRLIETGELEAVCPAGVIKDGRPLAYQVIDGKKQKVSMRYSLEAGAAGGAVSWGFELGDYDAGKELVLDPAVNVYCGYIGGSKIDQCRAIAVDSQGNAYVTGEAWTDETSFPVTVGPDLTFNGGAVDAFVAKVNAQGIGLDYCGYIGGIGSDYGHGIAVDAQGNAFVIGLTYSDETTFPVVAGPDLTFNGKYDTFVAKVNAQGTGLDYCGYIGGDQEDFGHDIVVDSLGYAYVAGDTKSYQTTFPVVVGPDLTHNGGGLPYDAFVAKVNIQGTDLDYCGYIGGNEKDYGYGIAVDGQGRALVVGRTKSEETSFPVSVGPDLTYNGSYDGFVTRVNVQGSGLDYCGYIGGLDNDSCTGIALDGQGQAYVTGETKSDELTFPVVVGPDLTHAGGPAYGYDGFVAKVHAQGTGLDYCGYIGGRGEDNCYGVAVDTQSCAYVTGSTSSDEFSFPVAGGPDLFFNGGYDAFVARVNAQGTTFDYCSYIGGDAGDYAKGIALDALSNAYVGGATDSTEANGFPVALGPDLTYNGDTDAFVTKIEYTPGLFLQIDPDPFVAGQVGSAAVTNGQPYADTFLFYSFTGPGSYWSAYLNVTIDLATPILGFGPKQADAFGRVLWSAKIPISVSGRNVWLQGAQYGQTTNVVATTIQ